MTDPVYTSIIPNPPRPVEKVIEAIYKVQAATRPLDQTGRVDVPGKFTFKYPTLGDVIAAIHKLCVEHKLLIVASVDRVEDLPPMETRFKGMEPVVRLTGIVTAISIEDGSKVSVRAYCRAQSGGDNHERKATTGLRRYGMMQLFNLASSDDPEADDDVGTTPGRPQAGRPVAEGPPEPEAEMPTDSRSLGDPDEPQLSEKQMLANELHGLMLRTNPNATMASTMTAYKAYIGVDAKLGDKAVKMVRSRLASASSDPTMTFEKFCGTTNPPSPTTDMEDF